MIQDSGFCKAIVLGIKNCFDFKGRASRAEFWFFSLFSGFSCTLADLLPTPISLVVSLIFIIPSISISVRRLHDVNYRGWWALPLINIWALVLSFFKGDIESNRFGPPPEPIKITLFDKIFVVVVIVLLLTLMVLNAINDPGQIG